MNDLHHASLVVNFVLPQIVFSYVYQLIRMADKTWYLQVKLPTGAEITIVKNTHFYGYLNVFITTSVIDMGKTQGNIHFHTYSCLL